MSDLRDSNRGYSEEEGEEEEEEKEENEEGEEEEGGGGGGGGGEEEEEEEEEEEQEEEQEEEEEEEDWTPNRGYIWHQSLDTLLDKSRELERLHNAGVCEYGEERWQVPNLTGDTFWFNWIARRGVRCTETIPGQPSEVTTYTIPPRGWPEASARLQKSSTHQHAIEAIRQILHHPAWGFQDGRLIAWTQARQDAVEFTVRAGLSAVLCLWDTEYESLRRSEQREYNQARKQASRERTSRTRGGAGPAASTSADDLEASSAFSHMKQTGTPRIESHAGSHSAIGDSTALSSTGVQDVD